jgi:IS30 family transposase
VQACARVLLPLADRIETITYDNGKEFASHAQGAVREVVEIEVGDVVSG